MLNTRSTSASSDQIQELSNDAAAPVYNHFDVFHKKVSEMLSSENYVTIRFQSNPDAMHLWKEEDGSIKAQLRVDGDVDQLSPVLKLKPEKAATVHSAYQLTEQQMVLAKLMITGNSY